MGEVIFGEKIGDVCIPRKAQHDLLVKCSGKKFIFSAFKATIKIYCKFAGFKEKGWRPLSPQQPIFDVFEWTDKDHLINLRWNLS